MSTPQPSPRGKTNSLRSTLGVVRRPPRLLGIAAPLALLGVVLGVQAGCSDGDPTVGGFSPGGASGASSQAGSGNTAAGGRATSPNGDAGSLSAAGADTSGGADAVGGSAGVGAGGSASTGGSIGSVGGAGDAGAPGGDATADAGAGDSGPVVTPFPCASDSDTSVPPTFPAVCALSGQWAAGAAVPGSSGDNAGLLGITPDELTLAWSEQSGSAPSFHVSDRANTSASFDAGQQIDDTYVIGLSPDGLRLVALSSDSSHLFEITRADRSAAFDTQDGSAFALINAAGAENGTTFQDGLISQDDQTLYYTTVAIGGGEGTLYSSTRSNQDPWPVGQAFSECELQSHDAALRHPTGVSSDGLTLFFFDGVRGIARAAWRQTVSSPFTWFVDLPDTNRPQPNAACSELYFSSPAGAIEQSAAR